MDFIENNRSHYDTLLAEQTGGVVAPIHSPHMSRRVGEAILDAYDFDPDSTSVMDYACGVGAVAEIIAPECKSLLGVDISQAVVDKFNAKVFNQGIEPDEMRAVCVELTGDPGELEGEKFDVVICAQAYHHFPDIRATTKILSGFLKDSSSVLIVVDMLKNEHSSNLKTATSTEHGGQIVAHKAGFLEEEIVDGFEYAGLADIEFEIAFEKVEGSRKLAMFIAVGGQRLSHRART